MMQRVAHPARSLFFEVGFVLALALSAWKYPDETIKVWVGTNVVVITLLLVVLLALLLVRRQQRLQHERRAQGSHSLESVSDRV